MASIPIGKKKMSRISQMILPKSAACRRVPAGCLAVYVGEGRLRFVIPTRYLGLPAFAALLERSEEEFGYRIPNGLLLPCEVSSFTALLHQLKEEDKHRKEKQKAHELLSFLFSRACKLAARLSSASPSSSNNNGRSICTPLLYKGSA